MVQPGQYQALAVLISRECERAPKIALELHRGAPSRAAQARRGGVCVGKQSTPRRAGPLPRMAEPAGSLGGNRCSTSSLPNVLGVLHCMLYNESRERASRQEGVVMETTKIRLTIDLPRGLVQQADVAVSDGAARSRNQLIARAVQTYLEQLENAAIDAEFAQMAEDTKYQALALEISRELTRTDREALELGEGER